MASESRRRVREEEEQVGEKEVRHAPSSDDGGFCLAVVKVVDGLTIRQMVIALIVLSLLFIFISATGGLYAFSFVRNWRVPVLRVSLEAIRQAAGGVYCNGNCWVPFDFDTCAPQFAVIAPKHGGIEMLQELFRLHPNIIPPLPVGEANARREAGEVTKAVQTASSFPGGLFASPLFDTLLADYGERDLLAHYMGAFEEVSPPLPALQTRQPRNLHSITGELRDTYFNDLHAIKRMFRLLPNAKVVVLLRDPVFRLHDAFLDSCERHLPATEMAQLQSNGTAHRLLEACAHAQLESLQLCGIDEWAAKPRILWDRQGMQCYDDVAHTGDCGPLNNQCLPPIAKEVCDDRLVLDSIYGVFLQALFASYPRDSVEVVLYEDLVEEPEETLHNITSFLGVEDLAWGPEAEEVIRRGREVGERWKMPKHTQQILSIIFSHLNKTLAKISRKWKSMPWV